jgi:two-component system sensor histidine kinase BasS
VKDSNNAHLREVTHLVKRQKNLLLSTIIAVALFAFLSYLFGKKFTQYALKDLDSLASYVKNLDVDSLTQVANFSHLPENDKIKLVSNAIHAMQATIKNDVDRIKRFVSNVSHEFKTPLMVMQSNTDLALSSQAYKNGLEKNVESIKRLNTLMDSLLHMTLANEQQIVKKEELDISPLIERISTEVSSCYHKDQNLHIDIQDPSAVHADATSLELIIRNLVDNAHKYAPNNATITISKQP